MSEAQQTSLGIQISQRTVLVTLETMRAFRGVDAESILALIDNGVIRWAWDIAAHGKKSKVCEYRIWARELVAPNSSAGIPIQTALDAIVGTKVERIRRTDVARLLLCSRPHVHRLVETGDLTPCPSSPKNHVTRASLVEFLRRRLINP